jgi:hypothetical protein
MTELEHAKAMLRIEAKVSTQEVMGEEQNFEQIGEDVGNRIRAGRAKCPAWGQQRQEYRSIRVDPAKSDCQINMKAANGQTRSADLQAFKNARNTCSEIVEADYQEQENQAAQCQARAAGLRPKTLLNTMLSDVENTHAKVKSLQASLLRYLSSCVPDAKLSAELSAMGLDALMQEGRAAREEWLAERAKTGGR